MRLSFKKDITGRREKVSRLEYLNSKVYGNNSKSMNKEKLVKRRTIPQIELSNELVFKT